jgi:phosphopantetheine adenylyltransferase
MFNKTANSADLLAIFRDHLIVNYARKNGFDFVVKGLNG